MEETEHIRDAIRIIWGKRKTILQWTALVFICSALLSLLLKNYYQATTTFYPASLDLSKRTNYLAIRRTKWIFMAAARI